MQSQQSSLQDILHLICNPQFLAVALLGYPTLKFVVFLVVQIVKKFLPISDFKKKYCEDNQESWAVVTGATDGIGLSFCKVLAKMGFNIVLISRNPQRLKDTVQILRSLQHQSKRSQFRTITFDFRNSQDLQKSNELLKQLQGLDIWLLINNVGSSYVGQHKDLQYEKIIDLININCISATLLSARLFAAMNRRQKKSAVINISSLAGDRGIPNFGLYSGSKSFINKLTEGLSYEYKNIDMLCLRPLFVASKLSRAKPGLFVPTADDYAVSGLKQLGFQRESYGTFAHQILGYIYSNFIPDVIFKKIIGKIFKRSIRPKKVD